MCLELPELSRDVSQAPNRAGRGLRASNSLSCTPDIGRKGEKTTPFTQVAVIDYGAPQPEIRWPVRRRLTEKSVTPSLHAVERPSNMAARTCSFRLPSDGERPGGR